MEEVHKCSKAQLEGFSYRILQLVAKSLSLPSNVKKIYLVELIYAKTNRPEEVDSIIQKVKWERQMAQGCKKKGSRKKLRLQGMEVSSTNTCHSPPIDMTPKQSQYSPEMPNLHHTLMKYQPKQTVNISPKNKSDRVLRSYTMKPYKRPNYSIINNSLLEVIQSSEIRERPKETQISIVSQGGRFPRFNLTTRCVVKKYKPNLLRGTTYMTKETLQPTSTVTGNSPLLVPAKRKRTLSGIYPIATETPLKTNYEFVQSIGFRRTDGKISKINALVQKPKPKPKYLENFETPSTDNSYRNVEVTLQDIINCNIDAQTFTNPSASEYMLTDSNMGDSYTNIPMLSNPMPHQLPAPQNEMEGSTNTYSVYYHKKIRAEQVRSKRYMPIAAGSLENEQTLPKINEVFSNFDNKDFSQPLYVQVSEENERIRSYPMFVARNNSTLLEGLYNFKNEFLTNQPLLQVATTTNTRCVFSTPVMTSAMQQNATATTASNPLCPSYTKKPYKSQYPYTVTVNRRNIILTVCDALNPIPREKILTALNAMCTVFEPDSQGGVFGCTSDEVSRVCDFMSYAEQDMTLRRYHEAQSTTSSGQLSQDLSSSATIPEMVEDALEIISQDGDYMERIGMDVRMQCILCSWAGSKIILEYHVRKEHSSQIQEQTKDEWNITYKLGSLVNQDLWLSSVSERDDTLYVLSVKYEDPDCFMCSLSILSSDTTRKIGTITLYNKVTGEPFMWHGQIPQLPANMPYENDCDCLKLQLSKLELLPNSANLKLHNRSLVLNSPSKVVVGQPELNDIHIIIFVKIQDA